MPRRTRFSLPSRLSSTPEEAQQQKTRKTRKSTGSTRGAQSTLTQIDFVNKLQYHDSADELASDIYYLESDKEDVENKENKHKSNTPKKRSLASDEPPKKRHHTQTLTQMHWVSFSDEDDVDDLVDQQLKSETTDPVISSTPTRQMKAEIPSSQSSELSTPPDSPIIRSTPPAEPEMISDQRSVGPKSIPKTLSQRRLVVEDTFASTESSGSSTNATSKPRLVVEDTFGTADSAESLVGDVHVVGVADPAASSRMLDRLEIPDSGDEDSEEELEIQAKNDTKVEEESEEEASYIPESPILASAHKTIFKEEIPDSDAESDEESILVAEAEHIPESPISDPARLEDEGPDPDVEESQIVFAVPPLPSPLRHSHAVWHSSQASTEGAATQSQGLTEMVPDSPRHFSSPRSKHWTKTDKEESQKSSTQSQSSYQLLTRSQMLPDSLASDGNWDPPVF